MFYAFDHAADDAADFAVFDVDFFDGVDFCEAVVV